MHIFAENKQSGLHLPNMDGWMDDLQFYVLFTVKTLNIGTPRPATVVVLNIKPLNFTMK